MPPSITPFFQSGISLETSIQLSTWLDARFGATTDEQTASDRLGRQAGLLVAHDLVTAQYATNGMADVFAAMHSCIDDWLETSPVPPGERRPIKRRAVRAGVIQCWTSLAEMRPDEPCYQELMEQTCAAVMVAELAEDQPSA
ncbi:hypothetical protein [Synechococcus sp. LTW-G]